MSCCKSLALRKRTGSSWEPAFWGNNNLFAEDAVVVDVRLPNSAWQLAMSADVSLITPFATVVLIIGVIILLLVYFTLQLSRKLTWTGPAALAGAFVLLCGVIVGLSYYTVANEHRQGLRQQAETARATIRSRLNDSLDYMLLLSLARASGRRRATILCCVWTAIKARSGVGILSF